MSRATRMRDGINAGAGGNVERAVMLALRYLEDSATRHPDLDQHPMFERTGTSGGRTKQYGDILAMHKGALRIIDVMFSSKADKTVMALERRINIGRTECYKQYFSPFLVTSNGGRGEQMTKYFKEARDALRTDPRIDSYVSTTVLSIRQRSDIPRSM